MNMLTKFAIDYRVFPHRDKQPFTHYSDDPIEAEDFLMHLLVSRAQIIEIRHSGTVMNGPQFDRLLKVAGERIASALLRESLGLDAVQIKDRFGFAA